MALSFVSSREAGAKRSGIRVGGRVGRVISRRPSFEMTLTRLISYPASQLSFLVNLLDKLLDTIFS